MTTQQRLEALESAASRNRDDNDRILSTLDTVAEVLSLLVARQEMDQLKDDMDPVKRKIIALAIVRPAAPDVLYQWHGWVAPASPVAEEIIIAMVHHGANRWELRTNPQFGSVLAQVRHLTV